MGKLAICTLIVIFTCIFTVQVISQEKKIALNPRIGIGLNLPITYDGSYRSTSNLAKKNITDFVQIGIDLVYILNNHKWSLGLGTAESSSSYRYSYPSLAFLNLQDIKGHFTHEIVQGLGELRLKYSFQSKKYLYKRIFKKKLYYKFNKSFGITYLFSSAKNISNDSINYIDYIAVSVDPNRNYIIPSDPVFEEITSLRYNQLRSNTVGIIFGYGIQFYHLGKERISLFLDFVTTFLPVQSSNGVHHLVGVQEDRIESKIFPSYVSLSLSYPLFIYKKR